MSKHGFIQPEVIFLHAIFPQGFPYNIKGWEIFPSREELDI